MLKVQASLLSLSVTAVTLATLRDFETVHEKVLHKIILIFAMPGSTLWLSLLPRRWHTFDSCFPWYAFRESIHSCGNWHWPVVVNLSSEMFTLFFRFHYLDIIPCSFFFDHFFVSLTILYVQCNLPQLSSLAHFLGGTPFFGLFGFFTPKPNEVEILSSHAKHPEFWRPEKNDEIKACFPNIYKKLFSK